MPNAYHRANAFLATAYGKVGDEESTRQAWNNCVAIRPDYSLEVFAAESLYKNPADLEHWLDGLRKAGLEE